MKALILLAFFTLCCSLSTAQTVVGPGSASINPIRICRWHTNPACQWTLRITNTSDDSVVTRVEIDVEGSKPIIVNILPGASTSVDVTFVGAHGLTADALKDAVKIFTRHKRPSDG